MCVCVFAKLNRNEGCGSVEYNEGGGTGVRGESELSICCINICMMNLHIYLCALRMRVKQFQAVNCTKEAIVQTPRRERERDYHCYY